MKLLFYSLVCFALLLVLCLVVYAISFSLEKSFEDKGGSFECGFQPFSGSGFTFSMPFFVISLMFLLFDVEILLVCFYPLFYSFSFYSSLIIWLVLFFVLLATLFEWFKGVLSWV
uniref:NADH-ubiquinone oxidoreductase chain 3 n=1 Tax=Rhizoglyphus robini TaxID=223528 RepID=A0A344AR60_9ACAR|nr:NADH dehydrogenase subunit 3 [Rhizoglyphus robini]AWX53536.1 NADH dehydrogenase subunit 3 [Rhizoglyphus robini]